MLWREVWPMEEKLRFIAAVLADEKSMTAPCWGIRGETQDRLQMACPLSAAGWRLGGTFARAHRTPWR
jgi:hypothetical protein